MKKRQYGIFKRGGKTPKYNLGKKVLKTVAEEVPEYALNFIGPDWKRANILPDQVSTSIRKAIQDADKFLKAKYLHPEAPDYALHPEFMKRFFDTADGMQAIQMDTNRIKNLVQKIDKNVSLPSRLDPAPFLDQDNTAYTEGSKFLNDFLLYDQKVNPRELDAVKKVIYNSKLGPEKFDLSEVGRTAVDNVLTGSTLERNRLLNLFKNSKDHLIFPSSPGNFEGSNKPLLEAGVLGSAYNADTFKYDPITRQTLQLYRSLFQTSTPAELYNWISQTRSPQTARKLLRYLSTSSLLPDVEDYAIIAGTQPFKDLASTISHEVGSHLKRTKFSREVEDNLLSAFSLRDLQLSILKEASPNLDSASLRQLRNLPEAEFNSAVQKLNIDPYDLLSHAEYLRDPAEIDAHFIEMSKALYDKTGDPWRPIKQYDKEIIGPVSENTDIGQYLSSLITDMSSQGLDRMQKYIDSYNKAYTMPAIGMLGAGALGTALYNNNNNNNTEI